MRGVKRKLRVHPLFLGAGAVSAITGDIFLFLAAVLAAILHECAHAAAARRYGYTLDAIVLMPYGAVVSGDLSGLKRREEIVIALAGPLANAATALLFVSLWWLFPETYPYTDLAAHVSLSLFLVNLLPAFPLDGGRVLRAVLRPLGERKTTLICRILTLLIAAGIFVLFVLSLMSVPNFSALFFSLFLAAGAFGGARYSPLSFSREKGFSRGVEERRVAISADKPIRDALRFLNEDRYLTLLLFEGENFLCEVSEEEFLSALKRGDYALPLRECAEM